MWWFEESVDNFKGFNITELGIDEAWLNISSSFSRPLWLYILSKNCHECPFQKFVKEPILPNNSYKAKINAQYGSVLRFRSSGNSSYAPDHNDSFLVCEVATDFGEFGVYSIRAEERDSGILTKCSLETDLAAVNTYLPIFAILLFWLLICLFWLNWSALKKLTASFQQGQVENEALINDNLPVVGNSDSNEGDSRPSSERKSSPEPEFASPTLRSRSISGKNVTKKRTARSGRHLAKSTDEPVQSLGTSPAASSSSSSSQTQSPPVVQHQQAKERLKSLDVFRGLSIIIMIFADDGGGGYYFFQHCTWDGLYIADLAFPWFLWICGVCIPFSINSKIAHGSSKTSIFTGIAERSVKLLFLGIIVNTSARANPVQLEYLRLPGVLQRFGICYFISSTLYLLACAKKISSESSQPSHLSQDRTTWRYYFEDLKVSSIPWLFVLLCVTLHTSLIFLLPVPNCPKGYLGPAGLHKNNTFPADCVGGAAGYIDRVIFGIPHIHARPTSQRVYGSGAFDPEGSLGILTSIFQVWLGVHTGIILLLYRNANERLLRFLGWSVSTGLIGISLCGGYLNHGWIPVNKNLWSLSFVMITSSAALFLLSVLYFVIDIRKLWSGRPLLETGMNSIFLYLAHELCHAVLPWHYSYGGMRTHFSRLVESSWGTALWIVVAVVLHNRRYFFIV